MPAEKRKITPADIIAYEKYAAERAQFRKNIIPTKKNRRMEVGPFATFYFENYETMWMQVQEMLRLIPETRVDVIERCSGHGGTFGVVKETRQPALKTGRPVFRTAAGQNHGHIASDCPLAAQHILHNVKELNDKDGKETKAKEPEHPIQIMARAFGLVE